MKKTILFILAVIICLQTSAFADWNVQNLSDEELMDYRRAINEELISRNKALVMEGEMKISDVFPDPVIANAVRGEIGAISIDDTATQDELDSITKISINNHDAGVTSIEGIHYLHNLKELFLYWQDGLTEIPEEIGTLSNLESLDIRKAGITEIPDSICNLTKLRTLNLKDTGISKLPDNIGNLSDLKYLDISETSVTDLPESIYALELEKFYR